MRTLHDPKTLARQAGGGRGIPQGRGSHIPQGRGIQSRSDSPSRSTGSSPAAGTITDVPAQSTGRRSSFIGLSNKKFLTQLAGKLGQRTLLAGGGA